MAAPVDLMARERELLAVGRAVVGVDEVGRGALAGPLCVGAVLLERGADPPRGLTDSKRLTPERRRALVEPLLEWAAAWSLGSASAEEVDAWGVTTALAVAAGRAVDGLATRPTHALVDGPWNLLRTPRDVPLATPLPPTSRAEGVPVTPVVKGDLHCASIAAASVLAKVARDDLMVALAADWPDYGWAHNKGYGTPDHLAALRRLGPTPHHRVSWRLPGPVGRAPAGAV
ncbi:MAG TPA: ribonuclease HII [Acidimicrobiales bacterium]|nr:ribonuclease HII [Acidimicrobiales bacterium]